MVALKEVQTNRSLSNPKRWENDKSLSPNPFWRFCMLNRLFRDEKGQDMVEYALLASFISIVAIATLRLIGPLIVGIYQDIQAALA
jgi:Flp pilus assembly pilin Flp